MARMPGTIWQGEHGSRAMDRYDVFCIHTIVGRGPAHAAHFSPLADGTIIQSRDTSMRSAANLDGNHRVIASENEDHGDRFGGTPRLPKWVPLTPEQVEANARIFAWLHKTHGIPLQLCPDSRPGSRGLAYHRQGIDGNFGPGTDYPHPGRVPGGERWTEHRGKVCPTDVRIDQLPDILARAIELVRGSNPEEAYMATTDAQKQLTAANDKLDRLLEAAADEKQRDRASWRREQRIQRLADKLNKTADEILDELEARP